VEEPLPADLPAPVARLLEAANGHDTEAFLRCFDEAVAADLGLHASSPAPRRSAVHGDRIARMTIQV